MFCMSNTLWRESLIISSIKSGRCISQARWHLGTIHDSMLRSSVASPGFQTQAMPGRHWQCGCRFPRWKRPWTYKLLCAHGTHKKVPFLCYDLNRTFIISFDSSPIVPASSGALTRPFTSFITSLLFCRCPTTFAVAAREGWFGINENDAARGKNNESLVITGEKYAEQDDSSTSSHLPLTIQGHKYTCNET